MQWIGLSNDSGASEILAVFRNRGPGYNSLERIDMVHYCLGHQHDDQKTASHYQVSYQQIQQVGQEKGGWRPGGPAGSSRTEEGGGNEEEICVNNSTASCRESSES